MFPLKNKRSGKYKKDAVKDGICPHCGEVRSIFKGYIEDHPYIMSLYLAFLDPTHLISLNTLLNVSKNGHFIDPPI